jgi:methyl-accepting chemotaxis protein
MPLQRAIAALEQVGEGDLTIEFTEVGHDEVGQLLKAIDHTVDRLRTSLGMVSDATRHVVGSTEEISQAVRHEMTIATEQSAAVTEITSTMEELSATSSQISENSSEVLQIATETLEDIKDGAAMMDSMLAKLSEISENNEHSIHEVMELGRKSLEITKVMDIINGIADQTKLIAFNAALEASSAGEAGKRFGVVAVEIRRLADSVMESTGDIRRKIDEIQTSINRLVVASEKGSKGIAEGTDLGAQTSEVMFKIVGGAQKTADATKQIRLSTQQQKTANSQVVISLKEIADGAKQISVSLNQTSSVSTLLKDMAGDLTEMVDTFRFDGDGGSGGGSAS